MATVTKGRTFVSGETVTPAKLNELVDNATVTGIMDADISPSAGITSAKLATNSVTTAKIVDANVTPAKLSQPFTLMTAQATTSGTSINFTGIPSWAKRITLMLNGVSTSGTSNLLIQLGSGSPATAGYSSYGMNFGSSGGNGAGSSAGFVVKANGVAAELFSGLMTITNLTGNTWVAHGGFGNQATSTGFFTAGGVTLSGALDRIRLTTAGTDTFDAGSANVMYE